MGSISTSHVIRFARRTSAVLALLCLVWMFFGERVAKAQVSTTLESGQQEQVKFGVHIASIKDLDFFQGSFKVAFWIWWVYDDENYVPHEQIELINAADFKLETFVKRTLDDGSPHLGAKFISTMWQRWDLNNFPFDRQELRIVIESVGPRSHQLQFYPDLENSTINPDVDLDGWRILGVNLISESYEYDSTLGVSSVEPVVRPRLTIEIPMKRDNISLFFRVYVGYLIAILITSLLYFVDVIPLQPRINMLMGSIFAAIGNKYVIDTNYPPPSSFSLSERIELSAFALIAIAFSVTVISANLIAADRKPFADRLNTYTVAITVPLCLVFIGSAIYSALK